MMDDFFADLFAGLIILFCVGSPIYLTVRNSIALFRPWENLNEKQQHKRISRCFIVPILGFFLSLIWMSWFGEFSWKEYDQPLIHGGIPGENYHAEISGEFGWWFWILLILSWICLWILQTKIGRRKPPLMSVFLIGGVCIGNLLHLLYIIQTCVNIESVWPLWVVPLNMFLMTIRLLSDEIHFQLEFMRTDGNIPEKGLNAWIYRHLNTESRYLLAGLTAMLPIIGIMIIILILTGQGADSLIKAFTMTADWTFSQQIPPPPQEYDGHYLCTVAAGGHRKLVKPIRMGVRNGEKIIVNRQLCIANAFEDLLIDRVPRLHRKIRNFYDAYGYPVSRHITTPFRADIVFLLMKPLEWFFLFILYLFDNKPESRIAMQYTGKKYHENI